MLRLLCQLLKLIVKGKQVSDLFQCQRTYDTLGDICQFSKDKNSALKLLLLF